MKNIKWDELLLPYEQAVSELSVKFRSLAMGYEALGLTSPIEMVAQRVKRPSSILSKASRKGIMFGELEEKIEDIAGIRLICRFFEDIIGVVRMIRSRDGKDMTIIAERDYISNAKPSGYRSYHIIIKYPLLCALGWKDVTCEIQIRTMSMNYWAVIEHALQYKHDGRLPADIGERLKKSAQNTVDMDKDFSFIRQLSQNDERDEYRGSKQKLIDELIKNIRVLYRAGKKTEAGEYNMKLLDLYSRGNEQDFIETIEETNILLNELL